MLGRLLFAPWGFSTLYDCGALVYCSAGGTGHEYSAPSNGVQPSGNPDNDNEGPAFLACCDADAAGSGLSRS